MTGVAITLRNTKGSALTYTELDANFSNLKTAADAATDALTALSSTVYAAPTTGTTVSPAAGTRNLIVDPAGTILALTVALPPTPADGQKFSLTMTQVITGLTLTHAGTIKAPLTAGTVNGFASWVYRTTGTTWYRIG